MRQLRLTSQKKMTQECFTIDVTCPFDTRIGNTKQLDKYQGIKRDETNLALQEEHSGDGYYSCLKNNPKGRLAYYF